MLKITCTNRRVDIEIWSIKYDHSPRLLTHGEKTNVIEATSLQHGNLKHGHRNIRRVYGHRDMVIKTPPEKHRYSNRYLGKWVL